MDERLTNLEIKIAFVENHVAELDELVRGVHTTLERLQQDLTRIAEMVANQPEAGEGATTMLDEKPPHY